METVFVVKMKLKRGTQSLEIGYHSAWTTFARAKAQKDLRNKLHGYDCEYYVVTEKPIQERTIYSGKKLVKFANSVGFLEVNS